MIFNLKKFIKIYYIIIFVFYYMSSIYACENENLLGADKPYATPYYIIKSNVPGPNVCIIGGTHGNEPAGYQAAIKLLNLKPSCGQLIIIPMANIRAVRRSLREIPQEGDLNRCYPGNNNGILMEKLAFEIFSFMKEQQIDMLIDLHESVEYHFKNNKYLGQTVIAYENKTSIWTAGMTIEKINTEIGTLKNKFILLKNPLRGSTAWAAGKYLQIPSFTLETCKKLKLSIRIDYTIRLVRYILEETGVSLSCKY